MSDYIKREDVINEIKRFFGYLDEDMIYRINIALNRIPSVDVTENVRLSPITTVTDNKPTEWVEVVRCKDCKYYHKDAIIPVHPILGGGTVTENYCDMSCVKLKDEDYCSFAERKDAEEEQEILDARKGEE